MNVLYRILLILVVAAIVGGVMVAAVGSGDSTGQPQMREGGQSRPEGGEDREGEGLPFGFVKSLMIMSIASGVYLTAGRLFNRKRTSLPAPNT